MRRTGFLLLSAALASCVTIEPAPDPRGSVKTGQRLVVMVYQSPGPWIVADPDNKAEFAVKLLPIGAFLQAIQEDKINELSKEIQPYLPRPRYGQALEDALIAALKAAHDGPVQTAAEAGISPLQRKEWNAASDQLDWRRKYFVVEPGRTAPRNYSKLLSLDDAVIVDVNLSFGLEPDADDRTLPTLSASTRLYRADTARMLWSREDRLVDKASSSTLTEFRVTPSDLTDSLYVMSAPLGAAVAAALAKGLDLLPPAAPLTAPTTSPDIPVLNAAGVTVSSATAAIAFSTEAAAAVSTGTPTLAVTPSTASASYESLPTSLSR